MNLPLLSMKGLRSFMYCELLSAPVILLPIYPLVTFKIRANFLFLKMHTSMNHQPIFFFPFPVLSFSEPVEGQSF